MSALALYHDACNVPFTGFAPVARVPLAEMRTLFELGYHLIPCGGETGKKPLRRGWNRAGSKRMPLETVISVMEKSNSCTYGIRLDGLAVVDCDTWDECTRRLVSDHIPSAQFQVRSPRGVHLYFRSGEPIPRNLKAGGVQIDFKEGPKHFMVGPGSTRPDGRTYDMSAGQFLPVTALGRFHLICPLPVAPTIRGQTANSKTVVATQVFTSCLVKVGDRNRAAFKYACSVARDETSFDDLRAGVALWARIQCENPDTFSDAEINKICVSVWRLRSEGRLYADGRSGFEIPRPALDLITSKGGSRAGNCMLLYTYLQASHGHVPNRNFAVVADAIFNSGGLPFSKSTIDRCKQELCRLGLIKLFRKGRHMEPDLYVLTPPNQIGG